MKTLLLSLVLTTIFVSLATTAPSNTSGKRIVCYFGSWAVYRYGPAKITEDQIQPGLCDVFIYTFVGLDEQNQDVRILDPYNDIGDEWHRGLMPLLRKKARAEGTKYLVAIGGWNEGSETYSRVVRDPVKRAKLVSNIIKFVETYDLDGLDLDWEYPGQRGGAPGDKEAFSALVTELRAQFQPRGWMLTAAVGANALTLDISYDIPLISSKLDMINVMTYDLHGSWEDVTGHNSPLRARSSDYPDNAHLNVESAIKAWIAKGADPGKINMGLASYGRTFTLRNAAENGMGAPAQGIAPAGWTNENGFMGYDEICAKNGSTWTTAWDDEQQVPYAYSGNKWVGFDDAASIRLKVCLAKELNLGGALFWTIETDDFNGNCNNGRYPLIRAATEAFGDSTCGGSSWVQPPQQTTRAPTVTTPIAPPPTTAAPTTAAPTTAAPTTAAPTTAAPTTAAPTTAAPTTAAPTTAAPTTSAPTQATTAPAPITSAPIVPPSKEVKCNSIGDRIRDPIDCSIFWFCAPGPDGSVIPNKVTCAGGLNYDPNISGCNYRALVAC